MRAAIVLLLALAGTARGDTGPRTRPDGFDHNIHDRDVVVSGAESLPCERCHASRAGALVGKPGHAACFGTCHGPAPIAPARGKPLIIDDNKRNLCTACHSEASLRAPAATRKLAVPYPPYVAGRDFALAIGHQKHGAIACTQCHVDRRTAPHARCLGCHDGKDKGPAMTDCKICHSPGSGNPDPPSMLRTAENQILVTGAFSHAKHAARSSPGKQCLTCHAGITATNDRQLPRVTAKSCAAASCHDGKASFPITAACTSCHKHAPVDQFEVARPDKRFSHTAHLPHLGGILACAGCHRLANNGEVTVAGHAPCATCHADDFGERRPKICGACHTATEPWRALVADQPPIDRSEFGATLDHGKHPKTCTSCHVLTTTRSQLRPPRGHSACTTGGCHAVSGGPKPGMTACDGCHQRGLADTRSSARLAARWSARATFDHAKHELSNDGPIACTSCHVDLTSPHVLGLASPPKTTCAPCHDGQTSFKLTGTECTRCHLGASK